MIKNIYKNISLPYKLEKCELKQLGIFVLPQSERQISMKKQLRANAVGDSWKSKTHSPGMGWQTGAFSIKISLDGYQEVKN